MHEMKKLLAESKTVLGVATFIFILGAVIGFAYPSLFEAIIAQMLEQLQDVAEDLGEQGDPLYISWYIFVNNLTASLLMLLVGAVFFLFPINALFANGLAVGYVIQVTGAQTEVSALEMFIFGILPHGILELPAVFVAGGVGLFLGIRLLGWLFGRGKFLSHVFGLSRDGDMGTFWKEETAPVLKRRVKGTAVLILCLAAVLLIAGLVEGFVTPVLIELFVNVPA